jgi:hypothetical protein
MLRVSDELFDDVDVSSASIQSGMLQSCVNAIKESLDQLPGAPRTQIGKTIPRVDWARN